ncbi:unnamed protein product [Candida verbasci]|uniref:Uncharacterized protein n=1 Tax=Candida verbasci TaxID=1227364 RepID=A0A9W4TY70_9ASCO|nr:unnamed protein product [Candida verbasci]
MNEKLKRHHHLHNFNKSGGFNDSNYVTTTTPTTQTQTATGIYKPCNQSPNFTYPLPSGSNSKNQNQIPRDQQQAQHFQDLFNSSIGVDVYDFLNPRKSPNMTYKEKINNWLNTIPFNFDKYNEFKIDCYPGTANSSNDYDSNSNSDSEIDLGDIDDLLELQAQKVTKYVTRLYVIEDNLKEEEVIVVESESEEEQEEQESSDDVEEAEEVRDGEVIDVDEVGKNYHYKMHRRI